MSDITQWKFILTEPVEDAIVDNITHNLWDEVKDENLRRKLLLLTIAMKNDGDPPTATMLIQGEPAFYWWVNDLEYILMPTRHVALVSLDSDLNDPILCNIGPIQF